jgi:benzoyl-CoA reductase/2-hydroxyglutaryl-CoA dehydratase subunit BcrC/BadD/HgdB
MGGDSTAWATLEDAYLRPWSVAEEWRASGGRVVGVLGHDLPREIIAAGGLLPIRLSPLRLCRGGNRYDEMVPEDLAAHLAPGPILVLGALLCGALNWIDALAIGRDSESHTSLFYSMRELTRIGEGHMFPPFAFCDLLRTPSRHSARYNRVRGREFAETVGAWATQQITTDSLRSAAADSVALAECLRTLDSDRRYTSGVVSGTQMLIAAGASETLPASLAVELLTKARIQPTMSDTQRLRLFITGSGQDDPWTYDAIERADVLIVGEDHEWGDDGRDPPLITSDPWDGLIDHYHLGRHGSARSGLKERTEETVRQARACGADAVLQIVFEHDDSSPWEIPALRVALGSELPFLTVTLSYGVHDESALLKALDVLRTASAHV